jgi:hypothetical protein
VVVVEVPVVVHQEEVLVVVAVVLGSATLYNKSQKYI